VDEQVVKLKDLLKQQKDDRKKAQAAEQNAEPAQRDALARFSK